jgi:hypothetical protein
MYAATCQPDSDQAPRPGCGDLHSDAGDCVALFIDNSNLFIEGKKFYAKHLKLRVPQDPCFRIDIGKLCDALLRGRKLNFGKLYGSEPPSLDTVWRKIREQGLNVSTYQRDAKDKEKELDNALTADATEYACNRRTEGKRGTVLIVAGDRDYCPVVEKILKYDWNVEMFAFSVSINNKLKRLEKTSEKFEIHVLEDMFCFEPRWYYVNRKFKTQRPNLRRRIRMPRNRTMFLEFANQFDYQQDDRKLAELADELTKILRVPCLYKPKTDRRTRMTRTLFVIGTTKTKYDKEEREAFTADVKLRESLRKIGVQDEQIELVISEVHPKKPERPQTESVFIDFCKLWKNGETTIKNKCAELFGGLQQCKTLIDYLQSETDVMQRTNIENKYLPLYDRYEDEDVVVSLEDTDYDYDSQSDDEELDDDLDDKTEVSSTETDSSACAVGYGFQLVTQKKRTRRIPTYSECCKYGYTCIHGQRCGRQHSKDEEKFFKMNEGKGTRGYKSKPCDNFFNRHSCHRGSASLAPMCSYYHSVDESRCYQCKRYGGQVGHAATECPLLITKNETHL